MPYALGIDVGAGHTAAAVCHLDGSGWRAVQAVRLGEHRAVAESVLWLSGDGSVVAGDAAAQRAAVEHRRVARGFVDRIGDDVPVTVGGEQYLAEELTAALVNWVIDRVEAQQDGPPEHVVITHPASWGGYRRGLLHEALRRTGLGRVTLLPRPVAAAESHAARAPVGAGGLLAVSHMDGETFEAAVVRRLDSGGFTVVGHVTGSDPALDDALVELLRSDPGFAPDEPGDDRMAAWRLRRECAVARERLSVAAEVSVPVGPGRHVRVSRARFEEAIEPDVHAAVQSLLQCVRSVGTHPAHLAGVALVGESARTPAVGRSVAARLPCRIGVDAEPETTVAKGAALAALRLLPAAPEVAIPGPRTPEDTEPGTLGHCLGMDPDMPPPRPPVEVRPLELPERRAAAELVSVGSRPAVLGALGVVVVVLGIGLTLMLGMFGGGPTPGPSPAGGAKPVQSVSNPVPSTTPPTPATEQVSHPSAPSRDEGGR
jgi:molecular chaperone DnaK